MEHEHTADAIRERLRSGPRRSYLRDWVYGGIDGSVTTFAVVSGVVGGELPIQAVLILGVANLLADGFSMAASNYSGTKTELEELERLREIEYRHVKSEPEGEREEIRQIFAGKGFEGEDLERIVEVITADHDRWVRTMLTEEYGLPMEVRPPLRAALSTFASFLLCGVVPLLPYVFGFGSAFTVSVVMTLSVFFLIGSARSMWSVVPWWRSGVETLLIGAFAAGLAYLAGVVLRGVTG